MDLPIGVTSPSTQNSESNLLNDAGHEASTYRYKI